MTKHKSSFKSNPILNTDTTNKGQSIKHLHCNQKYISDSYGGL